MTRQEALDRGCAATGRQINAPGLIGGAALVAGEWGPLPWWIAAPVAVVGYAYSMWWTALACVHDGWARGWWWQDVDHCCPDDDPGPDGEPAPQPDDPHAYTIAA